MQKEELEKLAEPLMKYLAENYHPHVKILITSNTIELLESLEFIINDEFIID